MFNVTIIGNLGADAEVVNSNGNQFCSLSIAQSRKYKAQSGEEKTETNWVDAIISNPNHPVIPFLKAGVKVCVMGNASLRVYSSKRDRMMKAGVTVRVDTIELCGGSSDEVPRELISPDDGQVFAVTKHYWCAVDTSSMKGKEVRYLIDRRGKQFQYNKAGFVSSVPDPSQSEEQNQAPEVNSAKR